MEHEQVEKKEEMHHHKPDNGSNQIAGAIIIAGLIIAGSILLKGVNNPQANNGKPNTGDTVTLQPAKVTTKDYALGDPNAKVTVIVYEDFQCPFCDRFFQDSEKNIINTYVSSGQVQFVYRDFAFLGPESTIAAEAARCAGDQGEFWDYHDYLFGNQKGENMGNFSDENLKAFAVNLGLNKVSFNECLDSGKYTQAINDSTIEGRKAGVSGTPKGFILKKGKVVNTIDGALPYASVKSMIDAALK